MREIKFRGIGLNGDGWVYSITIQQKHERLFVGGYEIYPKTIGQHTGLKDKNGIEIYEGDILTVHNLWNDEDDKITTKVRFELGGFIVDCKYQDYNTTVLGFLDDETEIEVIGNIHQNPELL